jgi:hypothetical protein
MKRNSEAICMFFGKTRNNFIFVTDSLLRFFQKNLQICEHKCHLKNVRSQISQCSVKKRTMHAQRLGPVFLCDFLLQLCCKSINVQKTKILFFPSFFQKSGKFMLTKFLATEKLMVSMVSLSHFQQLSESFFIFRHL